MTQHSPTPALDSAPAPAPTLVIPAWANGPDGSANGGYAAGLLAAASGIAGDRPIEVSLRLPPPLGTELEVRPAADGSGADLTLPGSDIDAAAQPGSLVAQASVGDLGGIAVPDSVAGGKLTPELARAASAAGFPYAAHHPFPRCLVCGVARDPELPELQVHPGPLEAPFVARSEAGAEVPVFADAWVPSAAFADPEAPELASVAACWAAMDCPSLMPVADPNRPAVLARFTVQLTGRARVGEPHVLVAWELARDGRKLHAASALLSASGDVLGVARALWIEVRPA